MRLRLLRRLRKERPAQRRPIDSAHLLRIYWETHEDVRKLLRRAA